MGVRRILSLVLFLILTAAAAASMGHAAPAPAGENQPGEPDAGARAALIEARLLPAAGAQQQVTTDNHAAPELASPTTLPAPIAFASDRGDDFDLYAQEVAGGAADLLTGGPGNDVTPVWSPDGSRLVFVTTRDGDAEVYVREADGSERALTVNGADDIHPAWSPNGEHVIFSSNRTGIYQIYTIPAAGGAAQQIGLVEGNALYPRYAPDGGRISYMRASITLPACDWNWDVWLMDVGGGNQVRVTTQLGGDLFANWTPDGRLLYASCRNLLDADLYLLDVNSGAEVRLTDWLFYDEWNAVAGPDGETIAFNSDLEGNIEVYTMAAAGGPASNVTLDGAADVAPSWQGISSDVFSISGRVTQEDGSPLPGLTVRAGGAESVTDDEGTYTISGLPAGVYTVRPEREGFAFLPPSRTVSGPPNISGQDFVGRDCTGVSLLSPLLIVNGWGGSEGHTSLDDDGQIRHLHRHIAAHGYVEGCNLFYALSTSPYRYLHDDGESWGGRSNATVIRDNVCRYASVIDSVYGSEWDGHFDIIGYSYGGLRARAFLENGTHYGRNLETGTTGVLCDGQGPDTPVWTRNLFTLGTPHGGEWPTLPLSVLIGLSAATGGLSDGINPEIPATMEMLPPLRATQNAVFRQPDEVRYYLLGGDVRQQGGPWLDLLYDLWGEVEREANDLAVHRSSAHDLLRPGLSHLYSNSVGVPTIDLHGQVPPPLPFSDYRSFVNPGQTFDNVICPLMQLPSCPAQVEMALSGDLMEAEPGNRPGPNIAESMQQPQRLAAAPTIDLAAGVLAAGEVITGAFALDGDGPSQIILAWTGGELAVELVDPTGRVITPTVAEDDPNASHVSFEGGFGLISGYTFTGTLSGTWSYTVTASALTDAALHRLLVMPPTPISVSASVPGWTPAGNAVPLTATVTLSQTTPIVGGEVSVRVLRPDGGTDHLALLDDGAHRDGAAGDGLFGGVYSPTAGGVYSMLFSAAGNYQGEPYVRTAAAYLTAGPDTAHLGGRYEDEGVAGEAGLLYEALAVTAAVTVTEANMYTLSAELYAGDAFLDQSTTTVGLDPGEQTITVRFDGDAIRAAGIDGPYQVRNVLLLKEAGVTLLMEGVDEAHTTAAYDHRAFGTARRLYLPLLAGR